MVRQISSVKRVRIFKKVLGSSILFPLFILVFASFAWTEWVDTDGSGQESIIISNNSGSSKWPSLYLDSNNRPHIAWEDDSSGIWPYWEIYYLKWNGSAWVDVDGTGTESINILTTHPNSSGESFPSLCLDTSGNPHIAWYDETSGNNEIYYLKWDGSAWVDVDGSGQESINISNNSGNSCHPSLYLDTSGNPHIAWYDDSSGNYEIYYFKWNGSAWVDADGTGTESINISNTGFTSLNPSLCLDTSGNPHIAWYEDWEIYYLKWNGSAWVDADGSGQESINISNNSGTSYSPSLYLDGTGNPHIAWYDDTSGNAEIYYLKWNGSAWVDADGTGAESVKISHNSGSSGSPSLYLDTSGSPRIAWGDRTPGNYEIYYLKWNGSAWVDVDGSGQESINISNNYGHSRRPSLCLDTSGNPHIAWYDYSSGNDEIYYLKWTGGYYIKGYVKDSDGDGIVGVTVSLSGAASGSYTTGSTGYYEFLNLARGNYTVTPNKSGWSFTPVNYTYSPLDSDQDNQNFTGTPLPVLEVSTLSLGFGEIPKPASKTMIFTISNSGGGTLSGTITTDRTWIKVEPTSFDSNDVTVSVTVYTDTLEVWRTYTGTVTIDSNGGVKTINVSVLPTCVKSYPNPYSLSSGKPLTFWGTGVPHATIKIYTLSGELVKTLKEINGEDKITWDGRNEDGERIVRGIYFFTTKNPKERNTGKFTVVR